MIRFIATIALTIAAAFVSGCAVGTSLGDNAPMVGVRLGGDDAQAFRDGGAQLGSVVGGLFGGPGGAAIGTTIGGLFGAGVAGILGKRSKKREDEAFDEGAARAVGVDPASRAAGSVPVAPVSATVDLRQ